MLVVLQLLLVIAMASCKKRTERGGVERAVRRNVDSIYHLYRTFRARNPELPSIVMWFTVTTIEGDWSDQPNKVDVFIPAKVKGGLAANSEDAHDVQQMFDFLAFAARDHSCGLVLTSIAEEFRTPMFVFDFDALLPELSVHAVAPIDMIVQVVKNLEQHQLIGSRWGMGVRVFTDRAFGIKSKGFLMVNLLVAPPALRSNVKALAEKLQFYSGDVAALVDAADSEGLLAIIDDQLAGFVLYKTTADPDNLEAHIKYLLVDPQYRGGLGSDLITTLFDELAEAHPGKDLYFDT